MNWNVLIAAAGPVVLGIFTLYFNYKSRIKEKKYEIQFKAREHLYKTYTDETKIMDDIQGKFNTTMGEFLGFIAATSDPNKISDYLNGTRILFKVMRPFMKRALSALEDHLRAYKLNDEKTESEIQFIKDTLLIDFEHIETKEIQDLLIRYMEASTILSAYSAEISEKKCHEMLGPFIG